MQPVHGYNGALLLGNSGRVLHESSGGCCAFMLLYMLYVWTKYSLLYIYIMHIDLLMLNCLFENLIDENEL